MEKMVLPPWRAIFRSESDRSIDGRSEKGGFEGKGREGGKLFSRFHVAPLFPSAR